jgi:hypothetical protein
MVQITLKVLDILASTKEMEQSPGSEFDLCITFEGDIDSENFSR